MPKRRTAKIIKGDLLSELDLEKRWGGFVSAGTIRNWRYLKKGPKYTKLGGIVVYRLEDVIAYEIKQGIKPWDK